MGSGRFAQNVLWHIARLGLKVQIIHPDRPWPGLKLLVAPGVQMIDPELVTRFDRFVAAGGHLVLTCRTGLMDRNGHFWEGPPAKPILHLIGASIYSYDVLPDDVTGNIAFGGITYQWNVWGDHLKPDLDTEVLAKYIDQFYAGTAAIIRKRHVKGAATYCGVNGISAWPTR